MKLLNDRFTLSDLRIPFTNEDTIFREDYSKYGAFTGITDSVRGRSLYYFHKKLDGNGVQICDKLLRDLDWILSNSQVKTKQLDDRDFKDIDMSTRVKIETIIENIKAGFIYINGIKFIINDYEPDGEYFELYSDTTNPNHPIKITNVKKYYSIVSGQYIIFHSNGIISSFDNVSLVSMSKDVRLDIDDIKTLWSK